MIYDQLLVCSVLGGCREGCWLAEPIVALAAVDQRQKHVSTILLPPYSPRSMLKQSHGRT